MHKDDYFRYGMYTMELAAAVSGFLAWKKIKYGYWKWFPVYLAVIFLAELMGEYSAAVLQNNELHMAVYNYFSIPLQFLFFYWLFYRYFKGSDAAWAAVAGTVLYIILYFLDIFWLSEYTFTFKSFSYMAGNIILLVLIILFFIRFTTSSEILHYRESRMFKVCIGLLLFYLGTLPFFGLWHNLWKYYPNFAYNYWYVQIVMGTLMYLCFAISFVWSKRN